MTTKKVTSAGRLLTEISRVKAAINNGEPWSVWVTRIYGLEGVHWTGGLLAYTNLCHAFVADVTELGGPRIDRYRKAGEAALMMAEPTVFPGEAQRLVSQHLSDLVIERIESADELLIQANMAKSIDETHLALVQTQLRELIAEIEGDNSSELGGVIVGKLREFLFVLNQYELYGSDGVQNAVASLIGTVNLKLFAGLSLSSKDDARIRRAFGLAKGAMDMLVYGYTAQEALTWAAADIIKFLPRIAGS